MIKKTVLAAIFAASLAAVSLLSACVAYEVPNHEREYRGETHNEHRRDRDREHDHDGDRDERHSDDSRH